MAILKKIKEQLNKIKDKKILSKAKTKTVTPEKQKDTFGAQEMAVQQAKFTHPEVTRHPRMMPTELPGGYDQDRMILQVRDPKWLHTYWDVAYSTWDRLKAELGNTFFSAKKILRVYDVSHVIFNGRNAHRFFDIEIGPDANNWYIEAQPGRSWCVDLGLRLPNGSFVTILRSNVVTTPLDGPSWITDEEWMIPDDIFARLYGMGFGLGKSSPSKAWQERFREAFSSGGLGSMSSPVKVEQERKFWLWVDCELIVYGATEPDAKVTVQGKQVSLRKDGTFTLRFALPDGKQFIPVKAVSPDNQEERNIIPIVNRETK